MCGIKRMGIRYHRCCKFTQIQESSEVLRLTRSGAVNIRGSCMMCWLYTILGSRGSCHLYMSIISTDVFSLIGQEGNRIRPFVIAVFELVWCGLYLYRSICIKPCKYIHTEGEIEYTYLKYRISLTADWT